MRILISLTSIPERFETTLPQVLQYILEQDITADILLNIPKEYAKWGAVSDESLRHLDARVIVHRPSKDFGPATKLLGALEYIREHRDYDSIITVDDDVVFPSANYLSYLTGFAEVQSDVVFTVGGITLSNWPYHNKMGLSYGREYKYVDAVGGVAGVVYPAQRMMESTVPFDLFQTVPRTAFHDDDAYFGAVLFSMGIKAIALPRHPAGSVTSLLEDDESGVAQQQAVSRRTNESRLFRNFRKQKIIGRGAANRTLDDATLSEMKRHFLRFANAGDEAL